MAPGRSRVSGRLSCGRSAAVGEYVKARVSVSESGGSYEKY